MAIYKCKMCGAPLRFEEGASLCTCDYCGTKQTISTTTNEDIQTLFNRANSLRMKAEFDKAAEIYEKILQRDDTDAEAYWGLVLCKYGIEYVEDPKTLKRIPTCHRTLFEAVKTDMDYKNAIKYAEEQQVKVFRAEATAIDTLQKNILSMAQNEDPYDVFICYKETDDSGKRTQDSVIANDIYHQLTNEGYKVFYAAITLEDKLGSEYEPYIFSALNTAKVMLAIGTKPEYFNAVWVKNEWSRFLGVLKKDRTKLLIPCYRDMDPYDLPDEFAHLQAQDMGKIGFINDLLRGIQKVVPLNETRAGSGSKANSGDKTNGNTNSSRPNKVIRVLGESISIGMGDGTIKEVASNCFTFLPVIGDEVEIYQSGEKIIVVRAEKREEKKAEEDVSHVKREIPPVQEERQNQTGPQSGTYYENPSRNFIPNATSGTYYETSNRKPKDKWVAFLLCLFLGMVGAHHFYDRKIGKGILYMFTAGLFYIGWITDLIKIAKRPNPYYAEDI